MSPHRAMLQRHLEELVRLNERLLLLTEARFEAMKSRDMARIETLMAEERQVGMAIFEEERKRQATVVRVGAELGRTPEEMSKASLAEVAGWLGEGGEDGPLASLRDRLRRVAGRVHEANQAALGLAQRLLPHFDELLGILLDDGTGGPCYTAAGQAWRPSASGRSVVDVRA